MLHWTEQPVALAPDERDCGGIFSGSATVFYNETTHRDTPVLSYSVPCGSGVYHAIPSDPSDPQLRNWTRTAHMIPKPSSVRGGFRDPTTAWRRGTTRPYYRMVVGCGNGEGTCMFKSADFKNWSYAGALHSLPEGRRGTGGGMWECLQRDFELAIS